MIELNARRGKSFCVVSQHWVHGTSFSRPPSGSDKRGKNVRSHAFIRCRRFVLMFKYPPTGFLLL